MPILIRAVKWIGSHGSRAVALSLFVGMALPPLSTLAKPILPLAVFMLVMLAFLRVGAAKLVPWARRPGLVVLSTLWMMVAWPLIAGAFVWATGLLQTAPDVALALTVMAVASPVMSAPAFALLVGLDASLSLAALLLALFATPLTVPLMASLVLGQALPLAATDLALRLAGLLAGAALVAGLLRRHFGEARISEASDVLDGIGVLVLFVFAVAIMDGVAARLVAEPWLVLGLTVLSLFAAAAMGVTTWLAFLWAGHERALALALAAGNRNMGLMAAAMAGAVPDVAWVFFAVGQLPIYMTPLLAQRLLRRAPQPG